MGTDLEKQVCARSPGPRAVVYSAEAGNPGFGFARTAFSGDADRGKDRLEVRPNMDKETDMRAWPICLAITATFFLFNCSSSRTITSNRSTPSNINDLVRKYYSDFEWRLPGSEEQSYAYLFARTAVLIKHRDEMVRTLEVVETSQADKIAVAFTRYSIGTQLYRDVVWLRKFDGEWRVQLYGDYSATSEDPFHDGKADRAKAIIRKAEEWKEANKEQWCDSDQ